MEAGTPFASRSGGPDTQPRFYPSAGVASGVETYRRPPANAPAPVVMNEYIG